jgi:hybrid cluster-associated redox disulfide protein
MTKKITKNMNIAEAIDINENVAHVFFEQGIGCVGCMMAHAESIEDGLKGHGLSDEEIDNIIKQINSKKE